MTSCGCSVGPAKCIPLYQSGAEMHAQFVAVVKMVSQRKKSKTVSVLAED